MTYAEFCESRSRRKRAPVRAPDAPPEYPATQIDPCQHAFRVLDAGLFTALRRPPPPLPPSLRRALPPPVL